MGPGRFSDRVAGLLFLALGGAVTGLAAQLPMGSLRLPGPGAFPAAIGLALMALAAALLFQARRAAHTAPAPPDETDAPERGGRRRVALVCALVAAFTFVVPAAGFLLASIVLTVALYAIGAGGRLRLGTVAAGVLTAVAAYALFAVILDVPLPRGSLWGF